MNKPSALDPKISALLTKAYRVLGFADTGLIETDFNRNPCRHLRDLSAGKDDQRDGGRSEPGSKEALQ